MVNRSLLPLVAAVTGGLALAIACSDTTSTSSSSSSSGSGSSSGKSSSSSSSGSSGEDKYIYEKAPTSTDATWSALYADVFGPKAQGGCAGSGTACHGSPAAAGVKRSQFVCADEAACLASITGDSGLVTAEDKSAPTSAVLFAILRKKKSDGSITGTQPKTPLLVYSEETLSRIESWIKDGAK